MASDSALRYGAAVMFSAPSREYQGYIFDCDGTLADSMPVHHLAWCAALKQFGATFAFDWDLFVSRAGMSLPKTVEALNEQFGLKLDPDAVASAQRREYARFLPGVQPITPVVEFARRMAESRAVSVASGGERGIIARTLQLLDLSDTFPVVITPEDVERGKPAPDMFLLAAERMGVAPSQCVVFEDSVLGIQAAERAGMASISVNATTV